MDTITVIRKKQEDFIKKQILITNQFIDNNIKTNKQIQSCMISGSVARGTFMPGKESGAIDLILFVENKDDFNANEALGPDLEKHIPGHFIKKDNNFYQIKIYDEQYIFNFIENNEAEKYSFFESRILLDKTKILGETINKLYNEIAKVEISENYQRSFRYMNYLINDYKVNRWIKRKAIIQLNQNLTKAINISIKCLFYINGKYSPAEDRALYFSFELEKKPEKYEKIIRNLSLVKELTLVKYMEREKLFKDRIIEYIEQEWLEVEKAV